MDITLYACIDCGHNLHFLYCAVHRLADTEHAPLDANVGVCERDRCGVREGAARPPSRNRCSSRRRFPEGGQRLPGAYRRDLHSLVHFRVSAPPFVLSQQEKVSPGSSQLYRLACNNALLLVLLYYRREEEDDGRGG